MLQTHTLCFAAIASLAPTSMSCARTTRYSAGEQSASECTWLTMCMCKSSLKPFLKCIGKKAQDRVQGYNWGSHTRQLKAQSIAIQIVEHSCRHREWTGKTTEVARLCHLSAASRQQRRTVARLQRRNRLSDRLTAPQRGRRRRRRPAGAGTAPRSPATRRPASSASPRAAMP